MLFYASMVNAFKCSPRRAVGPGGLLSSVLVEYSMLVLFCAAPSALGQTYTIHTFAGEGVAQNLPALSGRFGQHLSLFGRLQRGRANRPQRHSVCLGGERVAWVCRRQRSCNQRLTQ